MRETTWRRSSRGAANGSGVEVGYATGRADLLLADSAAPDAQPIALTREAFARLLTAIKEDTR